MGLCHIEWIFYTLNRQSHKDEQYRNIFTCFKIKTSIEDQKRRNENSRKLNQRT